MSSEFIDLCSGDGQSCPTSPPDYPLNTYGGVALRTPGGNPLFCGGGLFIPDCFEYLLDEGTYIQAPSLPRSRYYAARVELNDGSFWILGGRNEERSTTDFYIDGTFVTGPDLPTDNDDDVPCAVQIDADTTFFGSYNQAFFYDHTVGVFQETTPSPLLIKGAQCGAITTEDGRRKVVVAGGFANPSGGYTVYSEVWILDVATEEWTTGPPMLFAIALGETVQLSNTFLIAGGATTPSGSGDLITILEFDPLNMLWNLRSERLFSQRSAFFLIDVDKSRVCS